MKRLIELRSTFIFKCNDLAFYCFKFLKINSSLSCACALIFIFFVSILVFIFYGIDTDLNFYWYLPVTNLLFKTRERLQYLKQT